MKTKRTVRFFYGILELCYNNNIAKKGLFKKKIKQTSHCNYLMYKIFGLRNAICHLFYLFMAYERIDSYKCHCE